MARQSEETLLEFIPHIPWPFWLMIGIVVAILLWVFIFERDEPKKYGWDNEFWNKNKSPFGSRKSPEEGKRE